jgi:hypothetical protein
MKKLIATLALVALAACGSDSSTGVAVGAVNGVFALRTIDGLPLPTQLPGAAPDTVEALDDLITLTDAGLWSENGHIRVTQGGLVTILTATGAGSYTINGSTITLSSGNAGSVSGVLQDSTLTVTQLGSLFLYVRQ